MIHTVDAMSGKTEKSGSSYELKLASRNPDYQCTILAVTKEQFDSVKIGDTLEVAITVVQREQPAAEAEAAAEAEVA